MGETDEHVGTTAHAVFYQQNLPLALFLQLQGFFHDFGRVTLVVEIEHEAL